MKAAWKCLCVDERLALPGRQLEVAEENLGCARVDDRSAFRPQETLVEGGVVRGVRLKGD